MNLISSSSHIHLHHRIPIFPHSSSTNPPPIPSCHRLSTSNPRHFCAFNSTGGGNSQQDSPGTAYGTADLLRKPAAEVNDGEPDYEDDGTERREEIDWEDQILEDTVPLVGFVRMILHSGKYASGERLSPEHERTIVERLLPHHPESEKKIGCGISYITVGYHPDFESSRCLFIVRKDGEMVDFSYWKCIKGLIRKNYPLYADSFILRHFRKRRHNS